MSHMSRKEIEELLTLFETQLEKTARQQGKLPPAVGLETIRQELQECIRSETAPTVKLRHYARVLKHYLEDLRKPGAVERFNLAVARVWEGDDPQSAIKTAQRAYNARRVAGMAEV